MKKTTILSFSALWGIVGASALYGCSPRYHAPPTVPKQVLSAVTASTAPTGEGEGQVTFDTVSGRARVDVVTGRQVPVYNIADNGSDVGGAYSGHQGVSVSTVPLCVTPCLANLKYGAYELQFTALKAGSPRVGSAYIQVGQQPSIVRHAMGYRKTHLARLITGVMGIGFGMIGLGAGAAMLAAGETDAGTDLSMAGGVTLGISGVLTVGAIILTYLGRSEIQPGSTVQWTPAQ